MVELEKLKQTLTDVVNNSELSKRALARLLGVSVASLYYWVEGKKYPRTDVFAKICNLTETTPNEMFGLSPAGGFQSVDAECVSAGLVKTVMMAGNLGHTPEERLGAMNLRPDEFSRWKSRKTPFPIELVVAIMNAAAVTPDEFFYGSESRSDEADFEIDLEGGTFDNLEVLRKVGLDENGKQLWECKCRLCGNIVPRSAAYLRSYGEKNCGCRPIRIEQGRGTPGVNVPVSFVCAGCGAEIINTAGAKNRTYCDACRRERTRLSAQKCAEKSKRAKELSARGTKKSDASGLFSGMSMAQIEGLARENGMHYGRYRAMAEYLGRLDVKNALGGTTTA